MASLRSAHPVGQLRSPLVPIGSLSSVPRRRSELLPDLAAQSELDHEARTGRARQRIKWIGRFSRVEVVALFGFFVLAASGAV